MHSKLDTEHFRAKVITTDQNGQSKGYETLQQNLHEAKTLYMEGKLKKTRRILHQIQRENYSEEKFTTFLHSMPIEGNLINITLSH